MSNKLKWVIEPWSVSSAYTYRNRTLLHSGVDTIFGKLLLLLHLHAINGYSGCANQFTGVITNMQNFVSPLRCACTRTVLDNIFGTFPIFHSKRWISEGTIGDIYRTIERKFSSSSEKTWRNIWFFYNQEFKSKKVEIYLSSKDIDYCVWKTEKAATALSNTV